MARRCSGKPMRAASYGSPSARSCGRQPGVERALGKLRDEIGRGMRPMGKRSVAELSRDNLRWR
jgi:isopentenyl diphosphate isomerase/L-lactate dehydrogenase-like FMN-dependent dehydrogenase